MSKRENLPCKFNQGVNCEPGLNCKSCGWDPKNVGLRNQRIRAVLYTATEMKEAEKKMTDLLDKLDIKSATVNFLSRLQAYCLSCETCDRCELTDLCYSFFNMGLTPDEWDLRRIKVNAGKK